MDSKPLVKSCGVVFLLIVFYEWLFHGVLLEEIYAQNQTLWRPQAQLMGHMHWLMLGQLVLAVMFSLLFAKGYENKGIAEGFRYGMFVGVLLIGPILIRFAVQPLPGSLVVAWILGTLLEFIIAGMILAVVYRPAKIVE